MWGGEVSTLRPPSTLESVFGALPTELPPRTSLYQWKRGDVTLHLLLLRRTDADSEKIARVRRIVFANGSVRQTRELQLRFQRLERVFGRAQDDGEGTRGQVARTGFPSSVADLSCRDASRESCTDDDVVIQWLGSREGREGLTVNRLRAYFPV